MNRKQRRKSDKLGIQQQTYSTTQVQRTVERAVMDRDNHWIAGLHENILPLMSISIEIEMELNNLDWKVSIHRGDDLKKAIPLMMVRGIAGIYAEMVVIADKSQTDIPDNIKRRITSRLNGIRAIHNDNDNGEMLRQIRSEEEIAGDGSHPATVAAMWRDNLKPTGRPKGKTRWKQWLRDTWELYEYRYDNDENVTAADIRVMVLNDIAPHSEKAGERVLRDGLPSHLLKVFESLKSERATTKPNKYRDDLMKK